MVQITFFWCWMILPVTQSYNEAAEFKPCGRFKRAMLENVVFYALAAVLGIGFIAYLSTVHNLTGTALIEFVMVLVSSLLHFPDLWFAGTGKCMGTHAGGAVSGLWPGGDPKDALPPVQ